MGFGSFWKCCARDFESISVVYAWNSMKVMWLSGVGLEIRMYISYVEMTITTTGIWLHVSSPDFLLGRE